MKPAAMSLKLPCFRGFSGRIETAPTSDCNTRRGLTRSSGTSREGLPAMVPKTCSIEECLRPHNAKGLCGTHYGRLLRTGTTDKPIHPTSEQRFWPQVDKSGDCWIWTGPTNGTGYGRVWFAGKNQYPHRVSYELLVSPIPAGMFIDHICHKPLCVNPRHLRLANNKQNQENISGPRIDNGSGVRGVTWTGRNWQVRVGHNGRSHYAGVFYDIKEAEKTAIALRNRLFTHNNLDRIAS